MKGQSEILVFVLLFIISIFLFVSATLWSKNIFQQNVDVARIENTEKFMRDLNENIQSIIKFGGSKEIRYNIDGTIGLVDSETIEVKIPVTIPLPKDWINISSDNSYYIRERLEGDILRIQLKYPENDYKVELFTDGTTLSNPSYVYVERNQTTNVGKTVIKIKITLTY
jgi:hypothetical protein